MKTTNARIVESVAKSPFKHEPSVRVEQVAKTPEPNLIVQSPYTESAHLLDLSTLDHENAILAQALAVMRHVRSDYATAPYEEAFNWSEVAAEVSRLAKASSETFKQTSFYVVAFRSQVKPETDLANLGQLDKAAHAEAVASGGFLKYWFGSPNPECRNLATCIWTSREDAIRGGKGPAHREAAMSTRSLYTFWKIDQYELTIDDGAEGWDIEPWTSS